MKHVVTLNREGLYGHIRAHCTCGWSSFPRYERAPEVVDAHFLVCHARTMYARQQ